MTTSIHYGLPTSIPSVALQANLARSLNQGTQMIANPTTQFQATVNSSLSSLSIPGAPTGNLDSITHTNITGTMSSVTGMMSSFSAHTDSHIANFGQRAGTAEAAVQLNETLASTSSPCDLFNSMFGSIMGAGLALLNTINGLINQVNAAINAVLNAVGAAIQAAVNAVNLLMAQIQAVVSQVLNMISAELAALADWAQKLLNSALASILSLFNLSGSCTGLLVGAVATPAALAIMKAI